jgi:hypothetical protein
MGVDIVALTLVWGTIEFAASVLDTVSFFLVTPDLVGKERITRSINPARFQDFRRHLWNVGFAWSGP